MFYLDKKDERKTSAILLISRYLPNQRLVWSTGISVPPKDWDADKSIVKKTHKEHTWLNAKLSKYRSTFEQALADYRMANHSQPDHAYLKAKLYEIRDQLDGRTKKEQRITQKESFLEYLMRYAQRIKASPKTSPRTHFHFTSLHNNLMIYQKYGKASVNWDSFSYTWFEDWQNWSYLQVVTNADNKIIKDQLSQNTLASYWKNFRRVLDEAIEDGVHKNKDHQRESLNIGFKESDQVYLDMDELMQIYHTDLSHDPELAIYKDYLLFNGLCGGFRFGDIDVIGTKYNIATIDGIRMMRFRTSKTDTEVVLPEHWFFREFCEKYPDGWPKIATNQKFNEKIKEICRLAGIDNLVSIRISKGGQDAWVTLPKYELCHQYTLRYSFATNLEAAGIALQHIMRFLGHRVIKTTMRYIKTKAHQSALRVAGNAYFTTKPTKAVI